jgi:hypothetical protein
MAEKVEPPKFFVTGPIPVLMSSETSNCKNCGAPPSEQEVRNHDPMMHDGEVWCTVCNTKVRDYDAG